MKVTEKELINIRMILSKFNSEQVEHKNISESKKKLIIPKNLSTYVKSRYKDSISEVFGILDEEVILSVNSKKYKGTKYVLEYSDKGTFILNRVRGGDNVSAIILSKEQIPQGKNISKKELVELGEDIDDKGGFGL